MRYAAIILGILLIYLVALYVQAKSTVDASPKDEMYVCPTHGAMRKSAVMLIDPDGMSYQDSFSGAVIKDKLIPYCPMCYEDRIVRAKKG